MPAYVDTYILINNNNKTTRFLIKYRYSKVSMRGDEDIFQVKMLTKNIDRATWNVQTTHKFITVVASFILIITHYTLLFSRFILLLKYCACS